MGNELARSTQVLASEHYLHDLSSYKSVLKGVVGGGRRIHYFPVTRRFSKPNKILDQESRGVSSSGVVSIKAESVSTDLRNDGQVEGIRKAMAALMKVDNKNLKAPNELRAKKVKFRDQVEISAQSIIKRAESLVANSSVKGDASISDSEREKSWLELLSAVQHSKSTSAGRIQLVMQLLDMMYDSGTRVNAIHISAAVTACVKEKALNKAEQIVDRARTINKASVNVFAYSKLLQGYCSSNQRKEAFALLAKMDAEGVKPDVALYNTLIETEQSPEGVEILWRELETRNIPPNERTYCGAIRCYGRAGLLGAVRNLWHEMVANDIVFTTFTFNSLLDAYASVGDVETCKTIINEMEARNVTLSRDSYNTLLKAHARCRDADGAVGILRNMQRKGVKPCLITYNTAMDACIRGRNMLRAIGLAKELPLHKLKPDRTTYATLLVLMFYSTSS